MASTATKVVLGIGCGLLLVLGGGLATCAGCVALFRHSAQNAPSSASTPNDSSGSIQEKVEGPGVSFDDRFESWHLCKEQVLQRLRSPSTAEFIDDDSEHHHVFLEIIKGKTSPGVFLVTGEVDSQNGFGARLRSQFECSIWRVGLHGEVRYTLAPNRRHRPAVRIFTR